MQQRTTHLAPSLLREHNVCIENNDLVYLEQPFFRMCLVVELETLPIIPVGAVDAS